MKKYILLASILTSHALSFGMDAQIASLIQDVGKFVSQHTKQEQLLNALEQSDAPEVKDGNLKAIEALIKDVGINFQFSKRASQTPLMIALQQCNPEVIRLLLSVPGLNIRIKDAQGHGALHIAAINPTDVVPLKLLLEHRARLNPALDLNERCCLGGMTALCKAVHDRNFDAVKELCKEADVDPNIPMASLPFSGNYPLHEAMAEMYPTQLRMLRLLADKGTKIDCTNSDSKTPLLFVMESNYKHHGMAFNRIIALLALGALIPHHKVKLELKQYSPAGDRFGFPKPERTDAELFLDNCFHCSTQPDLFPILYKGKISKIINSFKPLNKDELNQALASVSNANAKDKVYGMTGLMWAAARGHLELAKFLINHPKIDLTATDNFGETALHYAARNGHSALVKLFVDYSGMLGDIKNNDGKTALDLAKIRDHKTAGRILDQNRIKRLKVIRSLTSIKSRETNPGLPVLPKDIAVLILDQLEKHP